MASAISTAADVERENPGPADGRGPIAEEGASREALLRDVRTLLLRRDGELRHAATLAESSSRARAVGLAAGSSADGAALELDVSAAGMLVSLAIERALSREDVASVVQWIADLRGVPAEAVSGRLFLSALGDPRLLELPPELAVEAQLRLLVGLGPISEASLWVRGVSGRTTCVSYLGKGSPSRRARQAATAALEGSLEEGDDPRGQLHAVPVLRFQRPAAALVGRVPAGPRRRALGFLRQASAGLSPVLEREMLLERNAVREAVLVQSSEKRLVRLGLDLHDGPIQDVVAIAEDLRLFRSQLTSVSTPRQYELLLGRIDDLDARLVGIGEQLRTLAHAIEPPTFLRRSLLHVLELQAAECRRSEIETTFDLRGDPTTLTASQQIGITRICEEALANVREHSGASRVELFVTIGRDRISVDIVDDGCGFEVERTLLRAARSGRLGLVGMAERLRLLGGRLDVRSSPGEGSSISGVLPRWRPVAASEPEPDAAATELELVRRP